MSRRLAFDFRSEQGDASAEDHGSPARLGDADETQHLFDGGRKVGVEVAHQLARTGQRGQQSLAYRFGLAAVFRQRQHGDPIGTSGGEGAQSGGGVIRGAVVHENQTEVGPGIGERQHLLVVQAGRLVVARYDDVNAGLRHGDGAPALRGRSWASPSPGSPRRSAFVGWIGVVAGGPGNPPRVPA